MGNYNDIWARVSQYDRQEKTHKKKSRDERRMLRKDQENNEALDIQQTKDANLNDEMLEGDEEPSAFWQITDHMIIKNYEVPPFNPGEPNLSAPGALQKYKNKFSKYLALIDCVKAFRSSKYCSVLALATTSNVLLSIWGSPQNISNAFKELKAIGLIKEYDGYYQTGFCKLYCYFVENEKKLIEHCKNNNISKMEIKQRQLLKEKQRKEYQRRCEEVYSEDFRKSVVFKSRLNLKRPNGVKPEQFKRDLYEMLYENYPGFSIYQGIVDSINETYYKDQPEFKLNFRPKFHWNENINKEKAKDKSAVVGIGIRVSNRLCSAKKDNDSIDQESKRIYREEVLAKYGFIFEADITSSVPRVAYALNHGGWLKEDVDLYKKIYEEISPDASEEDFKAEREAIKKLFFRAYFDSTDNKLAYHTWDSMVQDGMDKDAVYNDMIKLRRAMEAVLGKTRYDNFIFYAESCIYIEALQMLLEHGYKVWLVYDCFYGAGFGSQEEFTRYVQNAVLVSFMRFKLAYDFNDCAFLQEK